MKSEAATVRGRAHLWHLHRPSQYFPEQHKPRLYFKIQADWKLFCLRVKLEGWLSFYLKLPLSLCPPPHASHALLIGSSPRLTCTQPSMVKLITILLWKVRKSFRSKYHIPQNHTQQLLVCARGGGARSALPLQLSDIFAKKKKKWGGSKDGEGKKRF